MGPPSSENTRRSRIAVVVARIRLPLLWVSATVLLVGWTVGVPRWFALGLFVIAIAVYARIGTVRGEPIEVDSPVMGRWGAVNSPADRVPSHFLHAYGQTYAIDLVHVPDNTDRPGTGWWPLARKPDTFPAFGEPVLAPANGVVVRVRDGARDHLSRTSWPALAFMVGPEAFVREVGGPRGVLGNHVVLELADGVYAVAAHLHRGSVRMRRGERVTAGEAIGECGNSGSSSEPHLHFQLMEHRSTLFAAGLPLAFRDLEIGGECRDGVPSSAEPFVARASCAAGRGSRHVAAAPAPGP